MSLLITRHTSRARATIGGCAFLVAAVSVWNSRPESVRASSFLLCLTAHPAVGRQWDTHRAAYKDYDRSARLCCVGPGDMEQPPCRTADFNCVHRDICTKTQNSSLWLL